MAMDRATQGREIRKLAAAPDVMLASATAVTEDGRIVVASNTGSAKSNCFSVFGGAFGTGEPWTAN